MTSSDKEKNNPRGKESIQLDLVISMTLFSRWKCKEAQEEILNPSWSKRRRHWLWQYLLTSLWLGHSRNNADTFNNYKVESRASWFYLNLTHMISNAKSPWVGKIGSGHWCAFVTDTLYFIKHSDAHSNKKVVYVNFIGHYLPSLLCITEIE